MALETVEDIIRALQEHPEWREPWLNALLTDQYRQLPSRADRLEETLERLAAAQEVTQRTLQRFVEQTEQRFQQIEEQQRQQAARHDELVEKFIQLTARVDDLTVRLEQLTARVDDLTVRLEELTRRVDQLAAQMSALVERVERIEQDLGDLKGLSLEQYYRNNATALLGLFFRKLRVVGKGRLIDSLYEQRALSREEWEQISKIDLLVKGVHRLSGEEHLLVWEISWTVDAEDVSRALERASLLRRWGLSTVPLVAGKGITGNARTTALSRGVLVLLDTVPLDGSGLV